MSNENMRKREEQYRLHFLKREFEDELQTLRALSENVTEELQKARDVIKSTPASSAKLEEELQTIMRKINEEDSLRALRALRRELQKVRAKKKDLNDSVRAQS